ncbi:hypothetical protein BOO86_15265 [Mycobacterium sp. CBMA 234]|uniref:acyl-CoA dehydrogenase family protein n=1 Tax=Mycolicibacterium sp. CBMA 234 TaxID=1918495 RepID=UPI0012DC8F6A|nr:acyl-CoA dehydrogenase family protein [Mycolicibacterium sp. CBMA 234]MUL65833.1 hypothetical protein [Mycolicibacterium sp. CBMA 234]
MESADWVMVVASTGVDHRTGRARMSVFMVDTNSAGLTWNPIRTVMNQPDRSHEVVFDDVEVPAANLIGEEHRGLTLAFSGLNAERILTSSIRTGIGRYAIDKAVRYAKDRRVWDLPIGAHQAVAHPLAAAHFHLNAAQLVPARAFCKLRPRAHAGVRSRIANISASWTSWLGTPCARRKQFQCS